MYIDFSRVNMKFTNIRIIANVIAISAIFHIIRALAEPNGIRYYEDILPIKYTEIVLSALVIAYLGWDILNEMVKLSKPTVVSYDPLV